jgi:hypothetical protein
MKKQRTNELLTSNSGKYNRMKGFKRRRQRKYFVTGKKISLINHVPREGRHSLSREHNFISRGGDVRE